MPIGAFSSHLRRNSTQKIPLEVQSQPESAPRGTMQLKKCRHHSHASHIFWHYNLRQASSHNTIAAQQRSHHRLRPNNLNMLHNRTPRSKAIAHSSASDSNSPSMDRDPVAGTNANRTSVASAAKNPAGRGNIPTDAHESPTDVQDTARLTGNLEDRITKRDDLKDFYDVEDEESTNNQGQSNNRFGANTFATIIDQKYLIAALMPNNILSQDVVGVRLVEDINGGGIGGEVGAAGAPATPSPVPTTNKARDTSLHAEHEKRSGTNWSPQGNLHATRPSPMNRYLKGPLPKNPYARPDETNGLRTKRPSPENPPAIRPDAPKRAHGSKDAPGLSVAEHSSSPPEVQTQMASSPFTTPRR